MALTDSLAGAGEYANSRDSPPPSLKPCTDEARSCCIPVALGHVQQDIFPQATEHAPPPTFSSCLSKGNWHNNPYKGCPLITWPWWPSTLAFLSLMGKYNWKENSWQATTQWPKNITMVFLCKSAIYLAWNFNLMVRVQVSHKYRS